MATGESYFARSSHHHFMSSPSDHVFDFDESDIWNTAVVLSDDEQVPSSRGEKSTTGKKAAESTSMPMNIPDWSKILRGDYRENRHDFEFDGDEEDTAEEEECGARWFPPHEFLARQGATTTSFSVQEGMGRTLKGRDLSRVRNAIWKQTGFED